jgi:hypothetical protein
MASSMPQCIFRMLVVQILIIDIKSHITLLQLQVSAKILGKTITIAENMDSSGKVSFMMLILVRVLSRQKVRSPFT